MHTPTDIVSAPVATIETLGPLVERAEGYAADAKAVDADEALMVIQWGRQMPDPDASGGVILQAIVDGKTIPVYVSAEAKDDFGIAACKDKAEDKIRSAAVLPVRVDVTTADFR